MDTNFVERTIKLIKERLDSIEQGNPLLIDLQENKTVKLFQKKTLEHARNRNDLIIKELDQNHFLIKKK